MYQTNQSFRYIINFTFAIITTILLYLSYCQLASVYSSSHPIQDLSLISGPGSPPPNSSSDDTITTGNVATIIDTRPLDHLMPLLLHFSSVLGPKWPIILFTAYENSIPASAPFKRLIDERRIAVKFLPPTVDFSKRLDVSRFLTEPWLWEQLSPAKHVLVFQSDSILCSGSALTMDDFLEYDFVGAPIDPAYGEGYNGGLSLRNRSMVLDIIATSNWNTEFEEAKDKQQQAVEFEDQWFYLKMKGREAEGKPAARLPSVDVAKTFAVETVWYDTPLGYHQILRWQSDKIDLVEKWCPEYRLATSEVIS